MSEIRLKRELTKIPVPSTVEYSYDQYKFGIQQLLPSAVWQYCVNSLFPVQDIPQWSYAILLTQFSNKRFWLVFYFPIEYDTKFHNCTMDKIMYRWKFGLFMSSRNADTTPDMPPNRTVVYHVCCAREQWDICLEPGDTLQADCLVGKQCPPSDTHNGEFQSVRLVPGNYKGTYIFLRPV